MESALRLVPDKVKSDPTFWRAVVLTIVSSNIALRFMTRLPITAWRPRWTESSSKQK